MSSLINMRHHKHNNKKKAQLLKWKQERQPLKKVVESALSGSASTNPVQTNSNSSLKILF